MASISLHTLHYHVVQWPSCHCRAVVVTAASQYFRSPVMHLPYWCTTLGFLRRLGEDWLASFISARSSYTLNHFSRHGWGYQMTWPGEMLCGIKSVTTCSSCEELISWTTTYKSLPCGHNSTVNGTFGRRFRLLDWEESWLPPSHLHLPLRLMSTFWLFASRVIVRHWEAVVVSSVTVEG